MDQTGFDWEQRNKEKERKAKRNTSRSDRSHAVKKEKTGRGKMEKEVEKGEAAQPESLHGSAQCLLGAPLSCFLSPQMLKASSVSGTLSLFLAVIMFPLLVCEVL